MACKRIYKWSPEWINTNYGITLEDAVINVYETSEAMEKDYDMLVKRYPHLKTKFRMHVKTKGV